jgi:Rieske Fe-S protein
MPDPARAKGVTRRTFIGWWLAGLLAATAVAGLAPIFVYLWPALPKGQKKQLLTVTLDRRIDELADGDVVKFEASTSPNSAFVMADGGGDNAAGDLAFAGFVVKNQGKVNVLAVKCSHLGCSVAFNQGAASFDCPCHGSRFHPDGTVLHGPAAHPLSHLIWKQGDDPKTIYIEGLILGF